MDTGFLVEVGDGRVYLIVFERVEKIEVHGVIVSYQHAVNFAVGLDLYINSLIYGGEKSNGRAVVSRRFSAIKTS